MALAAVRLRRRLSLDEAARRSGLSREELVWLEEGRLYRFAGDKALAAAVLYGAALEVDLAEARELAGLPPPEPEPAEGRLRRLAVFAALATAVAALVVSLLLTGQHDQTRVPMPAAATLPPPWNVRVDVLNGAGDINWTRQVASRIGALGYRLGRLARADRFDYPRTAVYYEPGGQALASGSRARSAPGRRRSRAVPTPAGSS
ncbi:MAG TPA: LytR C-terminal domain-containing protein [Gaiellaceae bacterium]|nr:LytR C-terminal domain-containing protein [Gaiellaceae bacterium]